MLFAIHLSCSYAGGACTGRSRIASAEGTSGNLPDTRATEFGEGGEETWQQFYANGS